MASRRLQSIVTGTKIDFAFKWLLSVRRKYTEASTATIRGLCIDFDIGGQGNLTSIRASGAIPAPSAFILTLPGKFQVPLRTDCKTPKLQESTPRLPALTIGIALFCTNVQRVQHSPGIRDCRCDPAYSVTVKCPTDSAWTPSNFRLDIASANATLLRCSIPSRKHSGKPTNSAGDWVRFVQNSPVERPPARGANFGGRNISMGSVVTMRHVRRSVRNSRHTLPSFSPKTALETQSTLLACRFDFISSIRTHNATTLDQAEPPYQRFCSAG
jgi:hypothetical protein